MPELTLLFLNLAILGLALYAAGCLIWHGIILPSVRAVDAIRKELHR